MAAREALGLYRQIFRYSMRFKDYNIRTYAIRSTRDRFRANTSVSDQEVLKELFSEGQTQLEIIKRQATISSLYSFSSKELVVEKYQ